MLETTERTEDFKGFDLNLQLFADDGEGTSEAEANEKGEEKGNEEEVKTFTEEEVQARIQSESDKRVTEALKTARAKWEKEEELINELDRIYANDRYSFLEKIMIIENYVLRGIYKRK